MTIVMCMDTRDRRGVSFNGRRVSRDRVVIDRIMDVSAGHRLCFSGETAKLFEPVMASGWQHGPSELKVSDRFLDEAVRGDYCFAEIAPAQMPDLCYKVILFVWNREYPADNFAPDLLHDPAWAVRTCLEFEGNSHERITEFVIERAKA